MISTRRGWIRTTRRRLEMFRGSGSEVGRKVTPEALRRAQRFTMNTARIVESQDTAIECYVDETLVASVLRAFTGTTPHDLEIDSQPIPLRPLWLATVIQVLRWYRTRITPTLGQRCVFEPSCSRYAELAFRERGLFRGVWLIIRRLFGCRPGAGGVDLP
jgi:uncharacterized protein